MNTTVYTNGKIYTRGYILNNNGVKIYSPNERDLEINGWTIQINRDEMIDNLIRSRYSVSREFKVQRERDTNPDAFDTYNKYVLSCIKQVDDYIKEQEGSDD